MRLSAIQTEQKKLEGEIKESIARRRPTENCVRIYDDVIDKEWCNKVIELFENSKTERFNTGHKEYNELDIDNLPEVRGEMGLPKIDYLGKSYIPVVKDIKEKFIQIMKTHMDRYMKDVNIDKLHFPPLIDMENIRIKKYTDNGKDQFGEHVDVLKGSKKYFSSKRFLVFILYLSDVEEGGETTMLRYNIKCKPKIGRLLMFPPFWTHPHKGEKVIRGTKYIIMSYLHYGD